MDAHSWTQVALYPTPTQAETLKSWLFALTVLRVRWFIERQKDRATFTQQSRAVKELRHEPPFDAIPTTLLRSTAHVVDKSWEAGNRTPKPATSLEFVGTGWKLKDGALTVKPLGVITTRGPLPHEADKLTVTFRGGRWIAHFRTELPEVTYPFTGKAIGIDLGVKHLAVTSGGYFVEQHKALATLRRKLQGHRTKCKRATPGSRRWHEHMRRIERTEARIMAAQADLAHKTAHNFLSRYDVLFVEAVNVNGAGIAQHPIYRKACHDAGWQLFTDILTHQAENAGKQVVLVPAWYSSAECSRCGRYVPKTLETRTHHCPECGLTLDRDLNAARVIAKRGQMLLNGDAIFHQDWTPRGHPKHP